MLILLNKIISEIFHQLQLSIDFDFIVNVSTHVDESFDSLKSVLNERFPPNLSISIPLLSLKDQTLV